MQKVLIQNLIVSIKKLRALCASFAPFVVKKINTEIAKEAQRSQRPILFQELFRFKSYDTASLTERGLFEQSCEDKKSATSAHQKSAHLLLHLKFLFQLNIL